MCTTSQDDFCYFSNLQTCWPHSVMWLGQNEFISLEDRDDESGFFSMLKCLALSKQVRAHKKMTPVPYFCARETWGTLSVLVLAFCSDLMDCIQSSPGSLPSLCSHGLHPSAPTHPGVFKTAAVSMPWNGSGEVPTVSRAPFPLFHLPYHP